MIVVACPGQGSQTPGFLEPWLSEPAYRDRLEQLSDAAGLDLIAHGTVSDANTIRDTAIAQPLIVAASILSHQALMDAVRQSNTAPAQYGVAGHSVGEFAAAAISGVLTDEQALSLVAVRGTAMAQAAATVQTGMSAVVGADEEELLTRLYALGLTPANFNGGGQVVVAGELDALQQLAAEPPARARVIPLQVAGAFHTTYMEPAVARLTEAAAAVTPQDPTMPIWTNRDGTRVNDGAEFLRLMVGQVSSPVRWDRTMTTLQQEGVTGLIELAPAGALTGLAKRALRGVPAVAVKTPDDLASAVAMLTERTS